MFIRNSPMSFFIPKLIPGVASMDTALDPMSMSTEGCDRCDAMHGRIHVLCLKVLRQRVQQTFPTGSGLGGDRSAPRNATWKLCDEGGTGKQAAKGHMHP